MPKVASRPLISTFQVQRFDGGLNLRDAPTEIAPNETPDCMNVTLDERGGAESRLGITKLNGASLLPAAPSYLYYSTVADALLAYIPTVTAAGRLYKSTNGGVTWSEVTWTPGPPQFTAGAAAAIIDFKNRVVVVNTLDGVYSFPSDLSLPTRTTGGAANMEEVRGSAIAVWQNKLLVTGDIREDATHSQARVWASNAGNEQLWTVATAFIDIRDVDTKICTAIGAGVGMDVTGKPTLLVFKETSMYRMNDPTSLAYTTLHSKGAGAACATAIASNLGRICSINREGIWVTDGLAIPIRVSDKLQPLFSADGIDYANFSKWTAAPYRDRVCFNIVRAGASAPNLMLEYHPELGWAVPHKLSLGPMAPYTKQTAKLISASSGAGGEVYETFKGGTDDTVAIPARYQTPWVPLANGDEARLRYLRAFGRGTISAQLREDFAAVGEDYTLAFNQGFGFVWGVDLWDVGLWGDPAIEGNADTPLDEVCAHVSLMLSASTTSSVTKTALLGDGNAPEIGAWAVYGVKLDYIQLGT
jgi:hypothetical protein